MSTCDPHKALLELHLQGDLDDEQLADLKTHLQSCPECREEFEHATLMEDVIRDALLPQTAAELASSRILGRLNEVQRAHTVERRAASQRWFSVGRVAAAAAILAVGVLLGFALGRNAQEKTVEPEPLVAEPISITNVRGTVLVRHRDRDVWHILKAGSAVHVGDTFHSTAKSGLTLTMEDASRVELDQNSMLVLQSYNGETQFYLEHGLCRAALESPHPRFFVGTPHGRVEALGTEFTVKVE